MKKILSLCLLACLIFTLISGCAKEEKVLKIGAVFSTTGPASTLGVPEKNTADMLVEQINAAGGINGKNIEIVFYDTESNPDNCRTKVERLINIDKVAAIVGPTTSGESLKIKDLAATAKIPIISCAASVKIVEPVADSFWVFKTPQSDVLMGTAIAEYLTAQGISKVAIITTSDGYGASGKEQLEKILPAANIEIVAKEEFAETDQDVLVQLNKIKDAEEDMKAQAVVCWSVSGGGAIVTKNMKSDMKMEIPLIMSHGVANKAYIDLSGEAANGVVFPCGKLLVAAQLPDTDPQKAVLVKYADDYRAKFGEEPNTFGGHAWDAINLVAGAMKKVGSNKAKIRTEIENTKNFIGTGGVFNFSATDHNGLTKDAVVMIKIVDGQWMLAQ